MTLAELRSYVRDLTGLLSTELLKDTLLDRWLQEAYTEVCLAENWPWMLGLASGTLGAGQTSITLASGSGRIKEFTVQYANGGLVQVIPSNGLIHTVYGDNDLRYTSSGTALVLSRALDESVVYNVSYVKSNPTVASTGDATDIPSEFEGILAYRAAIKVLNSQADDSARIDAYIQEYNDLLNFMRVALTEDDDLGPIQLNGEALRVDGRTLGRVNYRFRGE